MDVGQYFQILREQLSLSPDGAWLGSDEHVEAFAKVRQQPPADAARALTEVLSTKSDLTLRYEALRLAAVMGLKSELSPVLDKLLERAGFYPLMGRRLRALHAHWTSPLASNHELSVEQLRERLQHSLWLSAPTEAQDSLAKGFEDLARQGEPGLFCIDRILGDVLEDRRLMGTDVLFLFRTAADVFDRYKYFEGVQVFFDFLAECEPLKPGPEAQATVGAILKAVRKLRPYRYPQWALPLQRFVRHFKKIRKTGRAAEANMLIILITASAVKETLLLDDDELVDLLRGRRDAAYTEEELDSVATLCDAVLDAGRQNSRIFHIRGWLAARLDGPEAAEPYFRKAITLDPNYVYSHLAISSLCELRGDDSARDYHLEAACFAQPTLISCHRKYGEILEKQERFNEAEQIYQRGSQIAPEQVSDLELEELFGCVASLAQLQAQKGDVQLAMRSLQDLERSSLQEQMTARFVKRKQIIIELLKKGIRDLRAEFQRELA